MLYRAAVAWLSYAAVCCTSSPFLHACVSFSGNRMTWRLEFSMICCWNQLLCLAAMYATPAITGVPHFMCTCLGHWHRCYVPHMPWANWQLPAFLPICCYGNVEVAKCSKASLPLIFLVAWFCWKYIRFELHNAVVWLTLIPTGIKEVRMALHTVLKY